MKASTLDNKGALLTVLFAALEAGVAILEVYHSDFAIKHKNDASPLSLADEHSHDIITRRLSQGIAFPLPVLSEEGRGIPYGTRKNWEYCWLVDPLDGTEEFIKRNGEFTVNIARIHKGISILGVIYIPVKNIFYFAAEDIGSYKLNDGEMMKRLHAILNYGEKEKVFSTDHLLHAIIDSSTRLLSNGSDHTFTILASRSHRSQETEEFIAT
jgi:3'(2'), 5'-bisphosphate nucleotidase